MPALKDNGYVWPFLSSFLLHSTAPDLDCRYFDQLNDATIHSKHTKRLPKNYTYSCHAVAPGSTRDRAKHWKPPFHLSKGGKIALIVIASVLGACLLLPLLRWCDRRAARRLARLAAQRNDIPLETAADGLPSYRRVGRAGEVPPGYHGESEVCETDEEPTPPADVAVWEAGTVDSPVYRETHTSTPLPLNSVGENPGTLEGELVMRERSL